ncbi:hypothetical protein [Larsenimonas suaedae]|uniref:Preprotein translocase subunit YajC n=1 Tax=Larsenimonas suaedae TaxID=1851019 RepID=A0ABU1GWC1_9GAMM|nr:hypothetical protein [Larsenimonas suaedae]MCM2970909.1 hypothetical protein [Larsenimonas suaedae]MDR5895618.1 hypothetical protein [Larsenimonas suaedae]
MTVFWIIAGLIFVALAPVISLNPSRRQRQMVALRDRARVLGFRVELNPPGRPHASERDVLAYRLMYLGIRQGPAFRWTPDGGLMEEDGALDSDQRALLDRVIDALPQDTLLLTSGTATLTLWWQERDELERFEAVAQRLLELRQAIAPYEETC